MTFRHVARGPGRRLVPDIATTAGKVSNHGLTWTFRLKPRIRFGQPVNRAVTSRDIEYAFERIEGTPTLPATAFVSPDFRSYFDGVILGMRRRTRAVEDISGIDSSAPRTIVFHLTRPTGDFPMRLALPATAPIPREVAHCFSSDGTYGRDLIATGPYMIAGEDRIDTSSCSRLRPRNCR